MAARRGVTLSRYLLLRSPGTNQPTSSFHSGVIPSRYGKIKQNLTVVPAFFALKNFDLAQFSTQKRCASQSAAAKSATNNSSRITIGPKTKEMEKNGKETSVVYQGPISSTIKKVKLLSLSTCCLSVSLGPVITFMTSPEMNVVLKGAVASSVIFLSASTTAALHWFVSPYVHKLRWQPGSDSFEVELMTWLATPVTRSIKFADVRPAQTKRPFVTFEANGGYYFVDAEHCHNKTLLDKLTPESSSPRESAFKNL